MDLDGLSELRAEFNARGWTRKATGAVLGELAVHVTLTLGGYLVFLLAESTWISLLGMLVSIYGTLGVSTNTHTSTHGGTSEKRWVNELFSYFGYPFFVNLSYTYWRQTHIVLHHPAPNVMGVDGDHNFKPFFASTDREIRESKGRARTYYQRYQIYVFALIAWAHTFSRQVRSWIWVIGALRDPKRRKTAHWIDLAAMIGYWVFWVVIPAFFLPLPLVLGANFLRIAGIGYPLFAILAPAHYPHDTPCVTRGSWAKDFLWLQTMTTIDYRAGRFGGFVCSGLQYQIEHHLFPSYSHVFYPKMAPLVRAFCEARGYPYRCFGWGEALLKVFVIFIRPKREVSDLEAMRTVIEEREALS
ncbi:MAG: acyl-CoA desaturase [Nannocystaceae bacterium]